MHVNFVLRNRTDL